MANRKVTLVRYCKTENGWRRLPVVMGGNGRVKPGFVMVDGKPVANSTGHYEIRFYDGPKLKYENVGDNAADALASCLRKQKILAIRDDAKAAGAKLVEEPSRRTLSAALRAFVEAAEDRGSLVAAAAYQRAGNEFLQAVGKVYADELTADDFTRYQKSLIKRKQSDRTVSNKHKLVVAFAKFAGVGANILPKSAPKYDVTLPQVYTGEQLATLFASITSDYHRLVFTTLLQTGLREQEAMYLQWSDIEFTRKTLLVRSKPELGFRIKDREERSIPLSDGLVDMLTAYRAEHPSQLFVAGTSNDRPNKKLLRTLKRLAHNAGLNCGVCTSCLERNECEVWFLHRFRSTYVTSLLRSGLDLRSTMQLSGHCDIESVMRYLRPAEGDELRARVNSIRWGS
jgi:integrase